MGKVLLLHDLATLQLWKQYLQTTFWSHNLPAVQVRLQQYSAEQNQNYTNIALELQKTCGCTSSGFFMSINIVAMMISFFISGNNFYDITLKHALLLTGYTVLAGLCGKLLGLLWARWRLLRLATMLYNTTGLFSSNNPS
nr:hypothetical protein [Nitrosomonas nitrosa]